MKQKLQDDLKAAMKSGDKLRTMTLRGILSEITRIEKDVRHEANDDDVLQALKRERSKREEALDFARKGNRNDLIPQYEAELKIVDEYMPPAISADEVKAVIAEQMAAGVSQIGPLMKTLRERFGTRLDGKTASELVKQALTSK